MSHFSLFVELGKKEMLYILLPYTFAIFFVFVNQINITLMVFL